MATSSAKPLNGVPKVCDLCNSEPAVEHCAQCSLSLCSVNGCLRSLHSDEDLHAEHRKLLPTVVARTPTPSASRASVSGGGSESDTEESTTADEVPAACEHCRKSSPAAFCEDCHLYLCDECNASMHSTRRNRLHIRTRVRHGGTQKTAPKPRAASSRRSSLLAKQRSLTPLVRSPSSTRITRTTSRVRTVSPPPPSSSAFGRSPRGGGSANSIRSARSARSASPQPDTTQQTVSGDPFCNICEASVAVVYCPECQMFLCKERGCVHQIHRPSTKTHHRPIVLATGKKMPPFLRRSQTAVGVGGSSGMSPRRVSPSGRSLQHNRSVSAIQAARISGSIKSLAGSRGRAGRSPALTTDAAAPTSETHTCDNCEEHKATLRCDDCNMYLCESNNCNVELHMPRKMVFHRPYPIGTKPHGRPRLSRRNTISDLNLAGLRRDSPSPPPVKAGRYSHRSLGHTPQGSPPELSSPVGANASDDCNVCNRQLASQFCLTCKLRFCEECDRQLHFNGDKSKIHPRIPVVPEPTSRASSPDNRAAAGLTKGQGLGTPLKVSQSQSPMSSRSVRSDASGTPSRGSGSPSVSPRPAMGDFRPMSARLPHDENSHSGVPDSARRRAVRKQRPSTSAGKWSSPRQRYHQHTRATSANSQGNDSAYLTRSPTAQSFASVSSRGSEYTDVPVGGHLPLLLERMVEMSAKTSSAVEHLVKRLDHLERRASMPATERNAASSTKEMPDIVKTMMDMQMHTQRSLTALATRLLPDNSAAADVLVVEENKGKVMDNAVEDRPTERTSQPAPKDRDRDAVLQSRSSSNSDVADAQRDRRDRQRLTLDKDTVSRSQHADKDSELERQGSSNDTDDALIEARTPVEVRELRDQLAAKDAEAKKALLLVEQMKKQLQAQSTPPKATKTSPPAATRTTKTKKPPERTEPERALKPSAKTPSPVQRSVTTSKSSKRSPATASVTKQSPLSNPGNSKQNSNKKQKKKKKKKKSKEKQRRHSEDQVVELELELDASKVSIAEIVRATQAEQNKQIVAVQREKRKKRAAQREAAQQRKRQQIISKHEAEKEETRRLLEEQAIATEEEKSRRRARRKRARAQRELAKQRFEQQKKKEIELFKREQVAQKASLVKQLVAPRHGGAPSYTGGGRRHQRSVSMMNFAEFSKSLNLPSFSSTPEMRVPRSHRVGLNADEDSDSSISSLSSFLDSENDSDSTITEPSSGGSLNAPGRSLSGSLLVPALSKVSRRRSSGGSSTHSRQSSLQRLQPPQRAGVSPNTPPRNRSKKGSPSKVRTSAKAERVSKRLFSDKRPGTAASAVAPQTPERPRADKGKLPPPLPPDSRLLAPRRQQALAKAQRRASTSPLSQKRSTGSPKLNYARPRAKPQRAESASPRTSAVRLTRARTSPTLHTSSQSSNGVPTTGMDSRSGTPRARPSLLTKSQTVTELPSYMRPRATPESPTKQRRSSTGRRRTKALVKRLTRPRQNRSRASSLPSLANGRSQTPRARKKTKRGTNRSPGTIRSPASRSDNSGLPPRSPLLSAQANLRRQTTGDSGNGRGHSRNSSLSSSQAVRQNAAVLMMGPGSVDAELPDTPKSPVPAAVSPQSPVPPSAAGFNPRPQVKRDQASPLSPPVPPTSDVSPFTPPRSPSSTKLGYEPSFELLASHQAIRDRRRKGKGRRKSKGNTGRKGSGKPYISAFFV